MKTKSKANSIEVSGTDRGKKIPKGKSNSPRKTIDSRDLNSDEDQTTNAHREEDWDIEKETDVTLPGDRSVEDEEDREARRRMEDANPDEILK